jgi:hypothetical protein
VLLLPELISVHDVPVQLNEMSCYCYGENKFRQRQTMTLLPILDFSSQSYLQMIVIVMKNIPCTYWTERQLVM